MLQVKLQEFQSYYGIQVIHLAAPEVELCSFVVPPDDLLYTHIMYV